MLKKLPLFLIIGITLILSSCSNCRLLYKPLDSTESYLKSSENVKVTEYDEYYTFTSNNNEIGFILFPDEDINEKAYAPLMHKLSDESYFTAMIKSSKSYNLASVKDIQKQSSNINKWYLIGHSDGGIKASSYLYEHHNFTGIILLSSYSKQNLSGLNLEILTMYGDKDLILNQNYYNENLKNLGSYYLEIIIKGGNCSYFADYGLQDGDGIADMTATEQIELTVKNIKNFIDGIKEPDITIPNVTTPDGTPEITTPEVTTPNVTTPDVTTPEVTTPEVTTPDGTPEITTPEVTTPEVTTPDGTPELTTPEVTTPEVTTPEVTTPGPILPDTPKFSIGYNDPGFNTTKIEYSDEYKIIKSSNAGLWEGAMLDISGYDSVYDMIKIAVTTTNIKNFSIEFIVEGGLTSWTNNVGIYTSILEDGTHEILIDFSEINPIDNKTWNSVPGYFIKDYNITAIKFALDTNVPDGLIYKEGICIINEIEFLSSSSIIIDGETIKYIESNETFYSPDQGFYDSVYISTNENEVQMINEKYLFNNSLVHLRIDLSHFSSKYNNNKDLELTNEMLESLDMLFKSVDDAGACAIIRFSYDHGYDGNVDMEPSISMILRHIEQITPIINKYKKAITAVECGLIGPWGEMHSSEMANQDVFNTIFDKYLSHLDLDIPFLVRRPRFIYEYYGLSVDELDKFDYISNRIGCFNDGYLGSNTDLGTFVDRDIEVEFLSKLNKPYGGEVTVPDSPYNHLTWACSEMFKTNLSYLNLHWNGEVVKRWQDTIYTLDDPLYQGESEFNYIKNHFGYRFVCKKLTYSLTETLNLKLELKNVGFGNLLREKNLFIILKNENSEYVFSYEYKNELTITKQIDVSNIEAGMYNVYFVLADEFNGSSLRGIQFANLDMYDEELKANKLLTINID